MRIFVPSARQKWFLESQATVFFGGALGSRSARGLEIVWADLPRKNIWIDQALSILMMEKNLQRMHDLINLGGIETKCQPNRISTRNLIGSESAR